MSQRGGVQVQTTKVGRKRPSSGSWKVGKILLGRPGDGVNLLTQGTDRTGSTGYKDQGNHQLKTEKSVFDCNHTVAMHSIGFECKTMAFKIRHFRESCWRRDRKTRHARQLIRSHDRFKGTQNGMSRRSQSPCTAPNKTPTKNVMRRQSLNEKFWIRSQRCFRILKAKT